MHAPTFFSRSPLPVDEVIFDVCSSLADTPNLLLHAPPGAGKTTRIPLALLNAPWLGDKRILMLEPRRLATRAAASRLAWTLQEKVGETVGYRIRNDVKVSKTTRIEVVTEGILTRIIQQDPELSEYGCIIFDEFHERSIHSDLGLTLCLESQAALREDLRIIAMSATLDCEPVKALMGDCPVIHSEGKQYDVNIAYSPVPSSPMHSAAPPLLAHCAAVIQHALHNDEGSILVFLPGAGEIRCVHTLLRETTLPHGTSIHMLFGDLSQQEQDAAIQPAQEGIRKVVLSTAIAETSLTIDGIRVVIDAGQSRLPKFSPQTGMTRLTTVPVSLASATQRAGRAGRTEHGKCYRLWPEAENVSRRPFHPPEITDTDLCTVVLELALWGVTTPEAITALPWLTPPPEGSIRQAQAILQELDAITTAGAITDHGSTLARLPLHPRLANMVCRASRFTSFETACALAALLSERDIVKNGADMRDRLALMATLSSPKSYLARIHANAKQLLGIASRFCITDSSLTHKTTRPSFSSAISPQDAGLCIALAYPDRVAKRRGKDGEFKTAGGKTVWLPLEDPLARSPWLSIADTDGKEPRSRIWRAAPLDVAELTQLFTEHLVTQKSTAWDRATNSVVASTKTWLGKIIVTEKQHPLKETEDTTKAVLEGVRLLGLSCLHWSKEARSLQERILFLRSVELMNNIKKGEKDAESQWPDVQDTSLLATLETWLLPFLSGVSNAKQLSKIDVQQALQAMLDWPQMQLLEKEAPTHLTVPSGSRIRLDYTQDGAPILPVKLQEMFGAQETPKVAQIVGGGIPVVIHLLSPAGRPLQVTTDLTSFWQNGYPSVRAEMRGRYPKHPWPENPLAAVPTRHTKRKLQQ